MSNKKVSELDEKLSIVDNDVIYIIDSEEVLDANKSKKIKAELLIPDLSTYETTTQLNIRDTNNRNRSNHTGTQDASTVTGLSDVATSGDYDDLINKPTIPSAAPVDSVNGQIGVVVLDKTDIGLDNVDNTSDADKPISDDTQTALNNKEDLISAGTSSQYWRGDKTFQELDKTAVGLSNVDNTSDLDKPISSATQSALDDKLEATDIAGKQDTLNAFDKAILYQASATAGDIQGIPNWQVNGQGGLTQTMSHSTNNGGTKDINNHNANIINAENSPNESYKFQQNNINIDSTDTGFNLGINGRAVTFLNNNVNGQSKASIGEMVFNENSFAVGNGVDAITARGLSYSYGFGTFKDNVEVNGAIQGYGFQPNFESGATMTSYVTAFYDFLYAPDTEINGYTSFQCSPTIGSIANNSNFTGFNINPTIDDFDGNAGFQGISLYGNLGTLGTNGYQGINIGTNIAEVGNATGINIGQNIDDCENYTGLNVDTSNVTATNKRAAFFNGDVQINGSLQFTGALSTGQLNAFYGVNPIDGGFQPTSLHGLITSVTALNSVTTANADTMGVNTAMLITLEEDSVTTSGPFGLGFSSLVLPCVVSTETNSSLDFMSGVVAAISLGASTGGTIDTIKGMRSVVVPNGVTTVNNFRGFQYDAPFGQVGTINHGFYTAIDCHNYFRGNLVVGELAEVATNSSVGLEIASEVKAFLNARMTTTQRNALTAVNGMQIYNTTDDKLQVYAAGSWVDLH